MCARFICIYMQTHGAQGRKVMSDDETEQGEREREKSFVEGEGRRDRQLRFMKQVGGV